MTYLRHKFIKILYDWKIRVFGRIWRGCDASMLLVCYAYLRLKLRSLSDAKTTENIIQDLSVGDFAGDAANEI